MSTLHCWCAPIAHNRPCSTDRLTDWLARWLHTKRRASELANWRTGERKKFATIRRVCSRMRTRNATSGHAQPLLCGPVGVRRKIPPRGLWLDQTRSDQDRTDHCRGPKWILLPVTSCCGQTNKRARPAGKKGLLRLSRASSSLSSFGRPAKPIPLVVAQKFAQPASLQ